MGLEALVAREVAVQKEIGTDILKGPYSGGFQDFPRLGYFLARDAAVFDAPEIHANQEPLDDPHPEVPLLTDQFSNLFQILW